MLILSTGKHRNTVENSCLHILLAHPCLYYYLLSLQYTVLHILFYCTFYRIFYSFLLLFFPSFFFHTNIYVYSLVFVLHIIALSMERD